MKHINGVWQQHSRDRNHPLSLITVIKSINMRKAPGIQAADYSAWLANKDLRDNHLASRVRRLFAGPGFRSVFDYDKLVEVYRVQSPGD